MKTETFAIVVLSCAASCASAADLPVFAGSDMKVASADKNFELIYNSDIRYTTFGSSRVFPNAPNNNPLAFNHARGSQFYVPFGLSLTATPDPDFKYEASVRSGYVSSNQTFGGVSANFSTVTDTVVSGTVTYFGINGIQPFASISSNLPSGSSAQFGLRRFTLLDPDAVDIGLYGQGFTAGPTVGANIPLNDHLVLTLSAGYTYAGPFRNQAFVDPALELNQVNGLALIAAGAFPAETLVTVKQADSVSGSATLSYTDGPLYATGSFNYLTQVTPLIRNFVVQSRRGDNYSGTALASYNFSDDLSASLVGTITHFENDFIPGTVFAGALVAQRPNINSNLYRVGFDATYRLAPGLFIGPTASIRYRDRNGFNPATLLFTPANTRYGVGGVAQYNLTDKLNLKFSVERIYIHTKVMPDQIDPLTGLLLFGTGIAPIKTQAWAYAGSLTYRY